MSFFTTVNNILGQKSRILFGQLSRTVISVEFFLAIVYVILILGITFPYGVPLFFPIIFLYFTLFFFRNLFSKHLALKLNTEIVLFLFCILMYLFGMLSNNGEIYNQNVIDLRNICGLLLILLILGHFSWQKYDRFITIYHYLIVPILSSVALFSIYNFYRLLIGSDVMFISMEKAERIIGISLSGAYNMFALGMLCGVFAGYFSLPKSRSLLFKVLCVLCILACSTAVILSGSRRGWIIFACIAGYLLIRYVISVVKSHLRGEKRIFSFNKLNLGVCIILLAVGCSFVFLSGQRNVEIEKPHEIEKIYYRFQTIFSEEGSFEQAFSARTERWRFALELIENFDFFEIYWGSGFEFVTVIGEEFHPGENAEGDPHNFIIASFLYSGLFGFAGVLALIILTIFRLVQNRDKFGTEFVLVYLTVLAFTITGAPSIFSVRLLPVLSLTTFSVDD
jgi:O-antigen ligase